MQVHLALGDSEKNQTEGPGTRESILGENLMVNSSLCLLSISTGTTPGSQSALPSSSFLSTLL